MKVNNHYSEYYQKGYCIIQNKFPDDFILQLRNAIDDIQKNINSFSKELTDSFVFEMNLPNCKLGILTPLFIIPDLTRLNSIFFSLLKHKIVLETSILLLKQRRLNYHFMNATIKHPGADRKIAWHRDFPNLYICPKESSFLRLMICLDGMDETNGATHLVRGSHLISDRDLIGKKININDIDQSSIEPVYCLPGSIVAIHPKVIHGGQQNISENPRRNIIIQIGFESAELVTENNESITGVSVCS